MNLQTVTPQTQVIARRSFVTLDTVERAREFAMIVANSGACPNALKGRPNDIIAVMQLGFELGLPPMQAMRTIGVVNGMPFAYGTGLLALVKRHPEFEYIKEWSEGDWKLKTRIAHCTLKRKGEDEVTRSFSYQDAVQAQLITKDNWKNYPERMLQHRARTLAINDCLPEATFGLVSQYEAYDLNVSNVVEMPRPVNKGMAGVEEALGINEKDAIIDAEVTPVQDDGALESLKQLIAKTRTSGRAINAWLKKAGVSRLEDLSADTIQKGIEYFTSKEQSHAV